MRRPPRRRFFAPSGFGAPALSAWGFGSSLTGFTVVLPRPPTRSFPPSAAAGFASPSAAFSSGLFLPPRFFFDAALTPGSFSAFSAFSAFSCFSADLTRASCAAFSGLSALLGSGVGRALVRPRRRERGRSLVL